MTTSTGRSQLQQQLMLMELTEEKGKIEKKKEEEACQGRSPMQPSASTSTSAGPGALHSTDDDTGAASASAAPLDESGDATTSDGTVMISDQEEFLTKIHERFVENVYPIESQLVDTLRQAQALSSEDEQSIAGENTRRKKARKLWSLLHMIPEDDFAASFVPKLKREYSHVMEGLTFRPKEGGSLNRCLRHTMRKRLHLKRLVDLLPSMQCCSNEDYRRLMSAQYCGDAEWQEVFHLLHQHSSNQGLCASVEALLRKKKIWNPARYQQEAARGFVCTCLQSQEVMADSVQQQCFRDSAAVDHSAVTMSFDQLNMRYEDTKSSATYPSSPASCRSQSLDMSDRLDSGMFSVTDELIQVALLDDVQRFRFVDQKKHYKVIEEEINSALTQTSHIRTNFRYLEKIRDDTRSLSKQADDETPSQSTNEQLRNLLRRAHEYLNSVMSFFSEVQLTWSRVGDLERCFDFAVPEDWIRYLRIRHHLLRNELQECQHFVKKASAVFDEVSVFCKPLPLAE